MNRWVLGLAGLLVGCVSVLTPLTVEYQTKDNPQMRRIDISYRNPYRFQVCLLREYWPDQSGAIESGERLAALRVEERRFPMLNFQFDYCLPDCAIRVAPGQEVTGFLAYSSFELPEELYGKPESLNYYPVAYRCK
jgi:hypothetical protein